MQAHLIAGLFIATLWPLLATAGEDPHYNRVTLSESAETEVENDLMVAVLFAQAEGDAAVAPADEVNRLMDWAVNLAQGHDEVKVQTLGYHTYAVQHKNSVVGWRVRQSLRLESRDSRLLGELVAKLQSQLQVQSIGYELSRQRHRHTVDTLTTTALGRFKDRAAQITKTIGRSRYRLVRLDINDGDHNPVPIARMAALQSGPSSNAVAPARIEAGTRTVSVSIRGEIELSAD